MNPIMVYWITKTEEFVIEKKSKSFYNLPRRPQPFQSHVVSNHVRFSASAIEEEKI